MATFPELSGGVDHKLCPSRPSLLACVYEGDVWVLDATHGRKHQLTHTAGMPEVALYTAPLTWCGPLSFLQQHGRKLR